MASLNIELQPPQDPEAEEMDMPTDQRPTEKTSVGTNKNPANQTGNFTKEDQVHMSIIANGVRTKGSFKVGPAQYNRGGGYWEYQLIDAKGQFYKNGAWIRGKDLRMEKK